MAEHSQIRVWDPFVRIFHWVLVLCFLIAFLTEEDLVRLHVAVGYIVLGLVLARVAWGFLGGEHARFSDFLYPLPTIAAYFHDLLRLRPRRYVGHNPAGGVMIIFLLLGLLATCLSGLAVYGADKGAGPLAFWLAHSNKSVENALEEIHEVLAYSTLLLAAIHVLGVAAESLIHRENLVWAMVTGRKRTIEKR